MNSAEISQKQWETTELGQDRRALLHCAAAAELSEAGRYEEAREALGDLWRGVGERPDTTGLTILTTGEVLLQCGLLSSWLGASLKVSGAQERAKDLLSEAVSGAAGTRVVPVH